jgi:hypothetical protein
MAAGITRYDKTRAEGVGSPRRRAGNRQPAPQDVCRINGVVAALLAQESDDDPPVKRAL